MFGPNFVFHYYFEVFIILSNRNNTYFRNLNFSGFGCKDLHKGVYFRNRVQALGLLSLGLKYIIFNLFLCFDHFVN